MFNFFKKCPYCKKRRFYIVRRNFTIKQIGIKTVSQQPMCGRCLKSLNNLK